MKNQNNKQKKEDWSTIEIIGWFFVLTGLVVFFGVGVYTLANSKFELKDAGSTIGGVVTSLWSLAGVFFFYQTLQMQKKELKLQRKEFVKQRKEFELTNTHLDEQARTFKMQLGLAQSQAVETTFFKLLDNRINVVESIFYGGKIGLDGLNELYNQLQTRILQYCNLLRSKEVKYNDYLKSPYYLIQEELTFEIIRQLSKNLEHIIGVIKEKMEDAPFYHSILFNALSAQEKYLIGMASELDLFPDSNLKKYWNGKYLDYYNESGDYCYKEFLGKLPEMWIELNRNMINVDHFQFELSRNNFSDFPKLKIMNMSNERITIIRSDFHYHKYGNYQIEVSRDERKRSLDNIEYLDLSTKIENAYLTYLRNDLNAFKKDPNANWGIKGNIQIDRNAFFEFHVQLNDEVELYKVKFPLHFNSRLNGVGDDLLITISVS